MKKIIVLTSAILLAVLNLMAQSSGYYTIPEDKSVVSGKLANGMTYFIKKNSNPAGKGEFFIVHNVGAIQEEDNQDGLAHFLEHMAFNGTKNFPGKTMLDYLNKIGVRFGYEVNAYTSKERTVYNISNVPLNRNSVVDSVLLMLHDWSSYITCDPKEINKERGVIREEWRLGDNARGRMYTNTAKILYTGSKFAERDVIGDTAVINNFVPSVLTDFYHKWYRPDLQAIVLVGDFDVKEIEKKVVSLFSKIPKVAKPSAKINYSVPQNDKPILGYFTDPESRALSVKLYYKHKAPTAELKHSTKSIHDKLAITLAVNMLGKKLDIAKDKPGALYRTAVAVTGDGNGDMNYIQMTVSPIGKNLKDAFIGLVTDMKRVKKYGFSEKDLALSKEDMLKKNAVNINSMADLKNGQYVEYIVRHFTQDEPLITDRERLQLERKILEEITLNDINSSLNRIFPDSNRVFVFAGNIADKETFPSESFVLSEIYKDIDKTLTPFEEHAIAKDLYDFSKISTGKIIEEKAANQFGYKEWRLSNGLIVYWAPNNENGSKIHIHGESDGGLIHMLTNDLTKGKMISNISRIKGLGNLNDKELKAFMIGKTSGVFYSVGRDAKVLDASSEKSDAELLMKQVYLNFTKPVFDSLSFAKFIDRQKEMMKDMSEEIIYMDSVTNFIYSGSPIVKSLKSKDLEGLVYNEVVDYYRKTMCNATGFKFVFSGPISENDAKILVERYLATLPVLPVNLKVINSSPIYAKGCKNMTFKSKTATTPRTVISVLYSGDMKYSAENYIKLSVLRYVLSDRYLNSIREEKGGAYYVSVADQVFVKPQNRVSLRVDFETDPKLSYDLLALVQSEIDKIVKEGPEQRAVNDAVLFMKKKFGEAESKKAFNEARFTSMLFEGVDLYDGYVKMLEKITPADLRKFAAELFKQNNKLTMIKEPETK